LKVIKKKLTRKAIAMIQELADSLKPTKDEEGNDIPIDEKKKQQFNDFYNVCVFIFLLLCVFLYFCCLCAVFVFVIIFSFIFLLFCFKRTNRNTTQTLNLESSKTLQTEFVYLNY
jgi:hypothetical protein